MNFKKLLTSTVVYTIIGFIPVASQLLLAPIFTRYLKEYEYGIITLSNIFGSYAGVFIGLGLDSAFAVYYFYYRHRRKWLERLVSTTISGIFVLAVLTCLITFAGGERLFRYFGGDKEFSYIAYGLPTLLISFTTVIVTVFQYYYRNKEDLRSFSMLSISLFLLSTAGQLAGLIAFHAGSFGVILGRSAGSIITLLGLFLFFYRTHRFAINIPLLKKLLVYGIPMAVYALVGVVFENIDRLSIEKYQGKSILGIYGFAVIIISVAELVRNSMVATINPIVYGVITSKQPEDRQAINNAIAFFQVVSINMVAFILAVAPFVLDHFINYRYHDALLFLPLLSLGILAKIYYSYFAMPMFYFEKTKALAIINILSFLAGYLYILLVKGYNNIFLICGVVVVVKGVQMLAVYLYFKIWGDKYGFNFAMLGNKNIVSLLFLVATLICIYCSATHSTHLGLVYMLPMAAAGISSLLLFRKKIKSLVGRYL